MTMIQLIACIGMIAGLFMVLHVSPRELSDSLFSRLTAAPGSIRADINETTRRKKAGFLRREITEAQAVGYALNEYNAICDIFKRGDTALDNNYIERPAPR